MRVAVLAAMRNELRPFTKRAPDGRVGAIDVTGVVVGIGTKAAGMSAARVIADGPVDHVIVIGIAGGVGPSVKLGDLVVPAVVIDHATGQQLHPTPLPGLAAHGTMRTSDNIDVGRDELITLKRDGVIALDMETAAIGAACEARRVPWSVVRAISDHTDDGFVDSAVLAMTGPDGKPNVGAVARYLVPRPWRIARLVKLAGGARRATEASARAAIDGITAMQ
jgi:adenosylhomocysteine nucleosidase